LKIDFHIILFGDPHYFLELRGRREDEGKAIFSRKKSLGGETWYRKKRVKRDSFNVSEKKRYKEYSFKKNIKDIMKEADFLKL